ncbi:YuzB family protein [Paenibacillus sp. FSL R5-0407]|uniref:YuzB family protein n=2 Tax=Paenibacillus TaxID=44249 RepID=UPI001BCE42FE|nr:MULTISPECIES: YuzB family protein [Paenibacillus]
MKPIIEFCANNAGFGTDTILNRLKEQHGCEVIEYGCLTGCGMCYMSPYALVNGETVAAETAEQLYETILKLIKEIEALE